MVTTARMHAMTIVMACILAVVTIPLQLLGGG